MSWLLRKIEVRHWHQTPPLGVGEIAADLVVKGRVCRTKRNSLSFWRVEGTAPEQLESGLLALAGAMSHPGPIDVTWVEAQRLRTRGIRTERSPGATRVRDLTQTHVDAVALDSVRLGKLIREVGLAVQRDGRTRSLTRREVVALVRRAVNAGRLHAEQLPTPWRAALDAEGRPRSGNSE